MRSARTVLCIGRFWTRLLFAWLWSASAVEGGEHSVASGKAAGPTYVVVVAHRGDHTAAHENPIGAIAGAIRADVRATSGGELVLTHDATVGRIASWMLPHAFDVIDAGSGGALFKAAVSPLANGVWGRFENHGEIDLTGLTRPAWYRLRVEDAVSERF